MKPWLLPEKEHLLQLIHQQNLPHAMIISGVSGAGKQEISHWLSKALLCEQEVSDNGNTFTQIPCQQCKSCNLHQQSTHPDFLIVEQIKTNIGVDQIRAVSRFFEKTSQLTMNQVVIVEQAETMTESAANALLKTLEEPTNNSFIILLVTDEQRLLPTIISRCRHISLKPPIGKQLLSHISNNQNQAFTSDLFVNLSHLAELSDENLQDQYNEVLNCFIVFLMEKQHRVKLLSLLIACDESIRWLEKAICSLLRQQAGWGKVDVNEQISAEQLNFFIQSNQEKIWQVYLLIKGYNKQRITLTQLNKEYAIEKLLVETLSVMNSVEG